MVFVDQAKTAVTHHRNAKDHGRAVLPILLLLPFAWAPVAATGAQTGATLLVMMIISGGCTVTTAASNAQLSQSPMAVTGTLAIACMYPTPYNVGLGPGSGAGATTMARWMTGPGGALARYGLFQDSALTTNFGSTVGMDTVAGIGSAVTRTIMVYGSAPGPASLNSIAYADVVSVTITF